MGMQIVLKKKFTILYVKKSSELLEVSEKSFFSLKMLILFFVNLSSTFVIQEQPDPLSNGRFYKDIYSFLEKFFN